MSRSSEAVRCAVAGSVLFLLSLPMPAAEPTYVKPEFGNAYTFTPLDEKTVGVSVPVAPEPNVDPTTLKVELADVAAGALHDPAWRECVRVRYEPPTESTTPAITVQATCATFRPLAYTVTVRITPPRAAEAKTAPEPQKLALQLTAPKTELRPIAAQTVTRSCLWYGCCNDSVPPLIVTEASGTTRLTEVSVQQVDPMLDSNGSTVAGRISSTTTSVEPGQAESIPLKLTREVPMGVVKTNVKVMARELATPLVVPFEIRSRLYTWWIFVAVLIGLALGFLLRVSLKRWIERGTARIAALDLQQKLETARGQHPDALYQQSVDAALIALQAAMSSGDAATITQGVTAGNDALTKALEKLTERLAAVATAIDQLAPHIERPDQFPEPIAQPLREAAAELDSLRQLAKDRDAAAAAPRIAALRTRLTYAVDAAATKWKDEIQRAVDRGGAMSPMPAVLAKPWADAFKALGELLGQFPVGTAPDLDKTLDAAYKAAYAAEHNVRERLLPPFAEYATRVAKLLSGDGQAQVTAAIAALSAATVDDPSTTLEKPVSGAAALLDAMKKAIRDKVKDEPEPVRKKVEEALALGDYEAAAGTKKLGPGQREEAPLTVDGSIPVPSAITSRSATVLTIGGHVPIEVARAQTWREIALAKAASSLGFGILIALAGLIALAPAFDGTWRGLVNALFWGYASDLTAEALTSAVKK